MNTDADDEDQMKFLKEWNKKSPADKRIESIATLLSLIFAGTLFTCCVWAIFFRR
jgi:hypothetical protein